MLYGKGVWLLYSTHLDPAVEMARGIGATHLFYRTGCRGMFFPEAALRVGQQARSAGLVPFAWLHAPTDHPSEVVRIARRSVEFGYQGVILDIVPVSQRTAQQIETLARQLIDAGFNPEALYYSAPSSISRHPGIPYQQLNLLCRGGFMPKCTSLLGKPPEVAVHKLTYEEHHRWSKVWGYAPPVYPVLSPARDEEGRELLTPAEFSRWISALAEHRPTFFSVFHAAVTPRSLWPLLSEMEVPRPPQTAEAPPFLEPLRSTARSGEAEGPAEPEEPPLVVTVQVSDTVWTLCERYGCTREQFWEWNGYLWDERGWPRDANYLQPGWRVRVR